MKNTTQIAAEAVELFASTLPFGLFDKDKASLKPIIKAAIDEARSRDLEAIEAASRFMDYLRANTGFNDEWPIELKVAEDSIEPMNRLLNEFESKVYAITKK